MAERAVEISVPTALINPLQSFKGEPAIVLNNLDVQALAPPFKLLLVGKFSYGMPSMESLCKYFHKLDLKGNFIIEWLDPRHALLQFDLEEDFMRIWVKGQLSFQEMPMRIFKWWSNFHFSMEPSVVPAWIALENLPVHLFHKEVLFSLARGSETLSNSTNQLLISRG
ncbi:hypothetical protein M9H77_22456 [Catharanthus roseus]|uniref:Uncharacterized protein n=1 Tax=Catharanthus roseus TaxID=4058 RepID=A0ACC0AQ85_CATRO|nr:hypothetical protein M9H77_22456 [Catharanthus roseus]